MEFILQLFLLWAKFSPYFSVDRAYRIPATCGPPGSPTHTFIFKLLHFRDRYLVLHEARNQGDLLYNNTKFLIFPDYSVETQRQRKSFDNVRAKLRAKGLKYSTLFPTKLRVEDGGHVHIFISPEDAISWIETTAISFAISELFYFSLCLCLFVTLSLRAQ